MQTPCIESKVINSVRAYCIESKLKILVSRTKGEQIREQNLD
ncbi:hypothetical protein [Helicobacter jaachi]|nr:hypothetical protein [Helicobacter jaachi]